MFKFKALADTKERTFGLAARLFGIDVSFFAFFWLNEWRLIDLRVPCNYGIHVQFLFFMFDIGRLPDDSIYTTTSE